MREYKVTAEGVLSLRKESSPEDTGCEISGEAGEAVLAYLHRTSEDTESRPVAVIYLLPHAVKMFFGDGMRVAESTKLTAVGDFMELIADAWSVHAELVHTDE